MKLKFRILISVICLPLACYPQLWAALDSGILGSVRRICPDTANNILYVGGMFGYTGDSIQVNCIAKWDGTNWSELNGGTNCAGPLHAVGIYQGNLYILKSGPFEICRWDDPVWTPLWSLNGNIGRIEEINGEMYVIGFFDTIAGLYSPNISKWNGTSWFDFNFEQYALSHENIYDIIEYHGEIYVGGHFSDQNAAVNVNVAKWNGASWETVGDGLGKGTYADVVCLAVYRDTLYAGGQFFQSAGNPSSHIAKWDGQDWQPVGGNVGGIAFPGVGDMVVFNDELYCVGKFFSAGGIEARHIAKWNGVDWCGLETDFTENMLINTISVLNDSLYIGGTFDSINSNTVRNIARWTGGNFVDTCGNTTGIQSEINNFETGISIYPNPSSEKFTIRSSEKIEAIEIYNVLGEKIFYTETYTSEMDVSQQPAGVYFLIARTKDDLFSQKIIKQ